MKAGPAHHSNDASVRCGRFRDVALRKLGLSNADSHWLFRSSGLRICNSREIRTRPGAPRPWAAQAANVELIRNAHNFTELEMGAA